jgi:hypothetical protein
LASGGGAVAVAGGALVKQVFGTALDNTATGAVAVLAGTTTDIGAFGILGVIGDVYRII